MLLNRGLWFQNVYQYVVVFICLMGTLTGQVLTGLLSGGELLGQEDEEGKKQCQQNYGG